MPATSSRSRSRGFSIEVPGLLKEILVKEGQFVKKGKELARFASLELETKRDEAQAQMRIKEEQLRYFDEQIAKELDPAQADRMRQERCSKTYSEWKSAIANHDHVAMEIKKLILRPARRRRHRVAARSMRSANATTANRIRSSAASATRPSCASSCRSRRAITIFWRKT